MKLKGKRLKIVKRKQLGTKIIDSTNDPNCVIGEALKVYILPCG